MNCNIYNFDQGTPEWSACRKGKLTASQVSEILTPTGKPSKSADGLLRKLARECVIDDPMEFEGNKFTAWGHAHEPMARDAFMLETGFDVYTVGFCERKDHPVLGCSPDGLVRGDNDVTIAGLEIKCLTVDNHVDALLDDEMPAKYAPQVHFSMAVTGLNAWYFVAFFPGLRTLIKRIERDEYTAKIEAAAIEFAQRYQQEAPAIWAKIKP